MLVLSRRVNEKVIIPSADVRIQVVGMKSGVVRLGFLAPEDVRVLREELLAETGEEPKPAIESPSAKSRAHALRNRLNAMSVGLALARQQATVGAVDGIGATLDRVESEMRKIQEDLLNESAAKPKVVEAKSRRALVVEDDSNECELLAGFLRLVGYEVETASDGDDALDHLRDRQRPDVVLLDMSLPKQDGATVVRAIRRNPTYSGLKVFAVTGYNRDHFFKENEDGLDGWFHKPLDPRALVETLNRELN